LQVAKKELPIPPNASKDGVEVLRVWINADKGMEVTLKPAFDDPKVWGILLVDIARHVARAYIDQGKFSEAEVARAIRDGFSAEWNNPTDPGTTKRMKK
jgi:hypothetical protein